MDSEEKYDGDEVGGWVATDTQEKINRARGGTTRKRTRHVKTQPC